MDKSVDEPFVHLERVFKERMQVKQKIKMKLHELCSEVERQIQYNQDSSEKMSTTVSIRYSLLESLTYERVKLLEKIGALESQIAIISNESAVHDDRSTSFVKSGWKKWREDRHKAKRDDSKKEEKKSKLKKESSSNSSSSSSSKGKHASKIEPVKRIRCKSAVQCLLSVGDFIFCGLASGSILVYTIRASNLIKCYQQVCAIQAHKSRVYAFCYSRGRLWSSCDMSPVISVWNLVNMSSIHIETKLKGHSGLVKSMITHEKFVVSGDTRGDLIFWHPKKLEAEYKISLNLPVLSLCQVGSTFYVGSEKVVIPFSLASKSCSPKVNAHDGMVYAIVSAENLIWTCSNDRTVRIWTKDGDLVKSLSIPDRVFSLASVSSPSGETQVWCSCMDKHIRVWDAKTFDLLHTLKLHSDGVRCLLSIPANKAVWSGGFDEAIIQWAFK